MSMTVAKGIAFGPKLPQRPRSYNESVDEPAKLIENESVEIEEELPAEENEPLEQVEKEDKTDSPTFEE